MPRRPRQPKGQPRTQSKTQYKTGPKVSPKSKTQFKDEFQRKPKPKTPFKSGKPKTDRDEKAMGASRPRPRPTLRKEDRPKARPVNERPKPQEKKISKTPSRAPLKKSLAKTPVVSHLERLQKIIASAGITSRRKAEELITQGRVTVNRETITELGAKADPTKDVIEVDGRNISTKGPRVYVLLNKPKGYISALSDPERRPVVTDLVKISARVYPVGRLDYDAEGVLLLTNDGELSNKLIHPNFKVPKKYLVKVRNVPTPATLERLEKGVHLEDGKTMPAKVRLIRKTAENSWIELTVIEGRNRLVKRMCMAVGHPVNKLKRVEFAGLKLGKLKPGEWRPLTEKEVEALKGL